QRDGTSYPYVPSPNTGGKVEHRYLVIHYTAAPNSEAAIRTLTNPEARASAHVVIGRDGSITQLVPFDRVAWHAGASSWEGLSGLNRYSLGIEIDNAGKLERHGKKWRAWFGREYDGTAVLEAMHKNETRPAGWHLFAPEQIEAALELSSLLVRRYGLIDLVGHDDISPGRKVDPGPAFPMESFRSRVLGRAQDEPVYYETTTNLNIRTGPGTRHEKIIDRPLPTGTRVEALDQQGSWRLVDVLGTVNGVMDLQGWVHGRYLRRVV
nr:N-acetylmuramoyl-L-alanine amidase [Pseudomonadota bacterium]